MPIGLRYAARSHVGMVRSNNQDSGYAGPHLLAMADGMGGHAGGDIASSVVISNLVDLDDEALGGNELGDALLTRIHTANSELADRIEEDPKLEGMGTTLIAIVRSRNRLVLAHIGDSRAFLARDGEVTQITKDHSYVQSLVDEGRITAEEATTHPQRSMVTRVLTGRGEDEPDLVVREARIGDRYLIASDGLTDYVAADTIHEHLLADRDPGDICDQLIGLALRAGAPDNVTCVMGDVVDISKSTPPNTAPEIVGSAALQRKGTRPIPVTPAEKAAALAQESNPRPQPEVSLVLAEEKPASAPVRWLRGTVVALLTLLVIGGGGYAAYAWSQSQYYVGDDAGFVTVFQGVNQQLGPIDLGHPQAVSEVRTDDLPDYYANAVRAGVTRPDETSAAALLEELRQRAAACVAARAAGQACATGETPAPTSTDTSTAPSITTSTTPSQSASQTTGPAPTQTTPATPGSPTSTVVSTP